MRQPNSHNPADYNIGALLAKRAAISGPQPAFVEFERNRRFTFAELNARCNRTANALRRLGIVAGDRVAVLLRNGIEFVETYFACAKIGAVLVPVNWRLVAREIDYILGDSGAVAVVFDADFDAVCTELAGAAAGVRHWLRVGAAGSTVPAFAADYDRAAAVATDAEPELGGGGDDLLFIMYTSGTTGNPKGVMLSHDNMLWSQLTSMTTADMRSDDRMLLPLPMFHVGCLVPTSQLVHRGATGVIMRDTDPAGMLAAIARERVSMFMAVPALLQFMLDLQGKGPHDLSSLRWVVTGAAPVPVSLLHAWRAMGVAIFQAYGLTESGGPGTLLAPQDAESRVGSAGKPQMHTAAKIVDGHGNTIPPGSEEPGELLLAGRHIMRGYWNRPEATAEVLRDGWLHTGDICTMDADGFITICDRKKDMVISGGENIYPAELEKVLAGSPEVADVAVIGIPSAKWGETPLAIVVPAPGAQPTSESLLAWCQASLAGYKLPRVYEFTDSLPRNASGKLLKGELRQRFSRPAPF